MTISRRVYTIRCWLAPSSIVFRDQQNRQFVNNLWMPPLPSHTLAIRSVKAHQRIFLIKRLWWLTLGNNQKAINHHVCHTWPTNRLTERMSERVKEFKWRSQSWTAAPKYKLGCVTNIPRDLKVLDSRISRLFTNKELLIRDKNSAIQGHRSGNDMGRNECPFIALITYKYFNLPLQLCLDCGINIYRTWFTSRFPRDGSRLS